MSRSRMLSVAVCLLALVLAGCGGGGDATSTGAPTTGRPGVVESPNTTAAYRAAAEAICAGPIADRWYRAWRARRGIPSTKAVSPAEDRAFLRLGEAATALADAFDRIVDLNDDATELGQNAAYRTGSSIRTIADSPRLSTDSYFMAEVLAGFRALNIPACTGIGAARRTTGEKVFTGG